MQQREVQAPLSDFKGKVKNVMASLCCLGNSDVNKTWIIRNFHLYAVQLWQLFGVIFVNADVVNAQSEEV